MPQKSESHSKRVRVERSGWVVLLGSWGVRMVLLGSWTCRGHVGDDPVGILDMQGTRRGWSCWDPGHAGGVGMVLLGS